MSSKKLHITNGDVLTNYLLNELNFTGDFITWGEMLCEGPTETDLVSKTALLKRQHFFNEFYNVEFDIPKFKKEIEKFCHLNSYDEIILWFEYDLFCHINMSAVLHLISHQKTTTPISLVCSGRVKGIKNLCGLAELSSKNLMKHYKKRQNLSPDDIRRLARNAAAAPYFNDGEYK